MKYEAYGTLSPDVRTCNSNSDQVTCLTHADGIVGLGCFVRLDTSVVTNTSTTVFNYLPNTAVYISKYPSNTDASI